jgi:hypothetical protein
VSACSTAGTSSDTGRPGDAGDESSSPDADARLWGETIVQVAYLREGPPRLMLKL